ncbi:MAG TPA: hypothetical protein VK791_07590 [bacterium]|nr:hypothetical protein [bacterium]
MKKLLILLSALFLMLGFKAWAENPNGEGGRGGGESASGARAESRAAVSTNHASTVSAYKPVVINMSHGSSGGHNRNFPVQQTQQVHAPQNNNQPAHQQPSYGQLHWNNQVATRPALHTNVQNGVVGQAFQRPKVQNYNRAGVRASVAVHHHSYVQGYVRKKLQKIGVSAEPNLITDRAEIIHTDRAHSIIKYPQKGPDHLAITASIVSPRHFNDAIVRDHMTIADSPEWQARADRFNMTENQVGHHYWHNDGGITYCHYLDASGYHWYGWYLGDQYFWTRNFNGRWWWYDSDFDRWCFWNNGFWWWQDPYHVADLYCYNDNNYIPCNSADDQVVVTSPDTNSNLQSYTSPDGTKLVKVDPDTQDAFLYDTANPPAFDPVYLASGVQSVQFSDTSNGRPMEIILKLNDGSFDMFDAQGNAYGPGANDADQASQGIPPAGPAYESAPPSNPPAAN